MYGGDADSATVPNLMVEVCTRAALVVALWVEHTMGRPRERLFADHELASCRNQRRDSYIPPWVMVCVVVIIPLVCFALPWVAARNAVETAHAILAWTLALLINAFVTETLKLAVGRPRPDFLYRCFPDGKQTVDLQCTGDPQDILEGRKSFPSGHSSFSFCSLGFLSFWMRGWRGRSMWPQSVLTYLLLLLTASVVAASRYYDCHHHAGDVVAGSVLGLVISYACYERYYAYGSRASRDLRASVASMLSST